MSEHGRYAAMQGFHRSRADCAKLLSLDRESIDAPTAPLIHQEARFLYILGGSGTIRVQGRSVSLKPDTLLSILPWQITEVTAVDEPLQYYLLIYDVALFTRFINSFYNVDGDPVHIVDHMEREPALYLDGGQAAEFRSYFESLREELGLESALNKAPERPLGTLWGINRVLELVILGERVYTERRPNREAPPEERGDKEGMLDGLLRYMYLHAGEKLTIGALAQTFRVPERTARAYLKEVSGRGFNELLNEMRIGKISGYLLYTDLTLDEISAALGYADASHLSKTFSDMTGMRISDYREAYRRVENICRFEHAELAYSLVQYLYRHYSEALSVNDAARQFGLPAREVNRLLVAHAEKNFSEMLNFIRVNMACRLMLSTDHTMTYISVEVGYANVKTFNRNFLRWRGMTPGAFRKTVTLQGRVLCDEKEDAHAGTDL